MQRIWYLFLRTYIWIGLHFYFRKIIVEGGRTIPDGPVIFAANHQNAFLDALMIVCFNKHYTHFLSRADIFKKPFTRWILSTLNMFPIYRIRDGWKSLTENKSTFDYCDALFQRNEAVVIFPEGNHGPRRNLRPLSKGFARLASASLQSMKIYVVPVGLNYSDHHAFRSSVAVLFGPPLLANDYVTEGELRAGDLRDELGVRLRKLITHVEDAGYESVIQQLEQVNPDYLRPSDTNIQVLRIKNNEVLAPEPRKDIGDRAWMTLFRLVSQVINFIPLRIWKKIRKAVKDPVLEGSVKFGVGIFLFPVYYFMVGALVYWYGGSWWAFGCLFVAFASVFFLKK